MSYNTPVLIINDALGDIERNPEQFVTGLVSTCLGSHIAHPNKGHVDVRAGAHMNAASVIPAAHADVTRVLVTHGNWMWEIPDKYTAPRDVYMLRAVDEKFLRDEMIRRVDVALFESIAVLKMLKGMES